MPILSLVRRVYRRFGRKLEALSLTEENIQVLRAGATATFSDLPCWFSVRYPGEITLPIHIMPLGYKVPPMVDHALRHLRELMHQDGVPAWQTREADHFEERQGHVWFATLDEGKYLPIGKAVFLKEKRAIPDQREEFAGKWWLLCVWISPAYRFQHIFANSVDYFRLWHPGFTVRNETPVLIHALKEHPEHLRSEEEVQMWW